MVQIHSPGHSSSFALSKIGSKGFLLSASIHQSPALRVTRQPAAEIRSSWSLHPGIDSDDFREMNRLSNRPRPADESGGWNFGSNLVPTKGR